MLSKNYELEISDPKKRKLPKKLLNLLFFGVILYFTICLIFYKLSLNKNNKSYQNLDNIRPDLIAVFTGDTGRIPLGLKLAKKYPNAKVFITGVYRKNTIKSLNLESIPVMDIDYWASNTIENGISTLRTLRKNPELKNILIISHDYHLMRINLIMDKLKMENEDYNLYFLGRKTDYTEFRNIKILSKEVIKLIRTYLLFIFWSPG